MLSVNLDRVQRLGLVLAHRALSVALGCAAIEGGGVTPIGADAPLLPATRRSGLRSMGGGRTIEFLFDTLRATGDPRGPAMSLAMIRDAVAVWTTDGRPVRLVWSGARWRVTDEPTHLVETIDHPLLTHPVERVTGWRFQATDEHGVSRVFDVRQRSGESWELLRVWD